MYIGELLPVVVLHDEIRFAFFNGPGRREAAGVAQSAAVIVSPKIKGPERGRRAVARRVAPTHWTEFGKSDRVKSQAQARMRY